VKASEGGTGDGFTAGISNTLGAQSTDTKCDDDKNEDDAPTIAKYKFSPRKTARNPKMSTVQPGVMPVT
jgi:hypothetical protein